MTEEMVLTPGGYRPKSKVHFVEPGYVLQLADGRIKKLDPAGKLVADLGPSEQRPAGLPVMPRHVSRPRQRRSYGNLDLAGKVVADLGSGWIAYADWTNNTGTPVSLFATTWTVPPVPNTRSGQTIFLFNGIQNSTMIYQPVLQWGASAAGGGDFWSVASWYADGQGGAAHYSTLVRVNPGDVLVGIMTLTGQSPQGFSYNSQFQGIANTGLAIQNVQELIWCIETLEAYHITKATDYPATTVTAFRSIELQVNTAPPTDPAMNWTAVDSVTDTGQHAIVVSNANSGGEVDIYYNEYNEWLQALYADLLSRAPDPVGLAYWTSQLTSGASLDSVAHGILNSQEYCTKVATGLYQELLSRAPDAGGLATQTSALEQGTALQQIILNFCNSDEYTANNPPPAQFVESLYNRLLGRPSDPAGKQDWINALQAGRGTTFVINGFLRSQEYCTNTATGLYQTLLGRQPDPAGLAVQVNALTGGASFQQIQSNFLQSAEYLDRALARF